MRIFRLALVETCDRQRNRCGLNRARVTFPSRKTRAASLKLMPFCLAQPFAISETLIESSSRPSQGGGHWCGSRSAAKGVSPRSMQSPRGNFPLDEIGDVSCQFNQLLRSSRTARSAPSAATNRCGFRGRVIIAETNRSRPLIPCSNAISSVRIFFYAPLFPT